ncbi:hypothetical protein DFH11DRAFT_1572468 [Phellopilus nigrolimitatus]|nr:hypothetical protein DFH11DRAFT_1572468 [Phellopilus nigrolimitatus]
MCGGIWKMVLRLLFCFFPTKSLSTYLLNERIGVQNIYVYEWRTLGGFARDSRARRGTEENPVSVHCPRQPWECFRKRG